MDIPAREFLEDKSGTININYLRPPAPTMNPSVHPLIFMQTDADYTIVSGDIPVVRLFGVTEGGNSVMLLVYNFEPYFYVPLPSNLPFGPDDKDALIQTLMACLILIAHNKLIGLYKEQHQTH